MTFGIPMTSDRRRVVAIGNALGLRPARNGDVGHCFGLGRTVTASSATATETLNNMIQTDAAINPGNSGGLCSTPR